jgi:diaminohydroxyphosphoribosylaminopyrimidine deaminase / 5-amino-6-(5-phosphoribosylamino)uracil reductase
LKQKKELQIGNGFRLQPLFVRSYKGTGFIYYLKNFKVFFVLKEVKNYSNQDALFMRRAFDLARRGQGAVSPNPMVGCVITLDNQIIGEGWHQKYGQAHAEVNAVNSIEDKKLLSQATAYVSLEPCSHFGKTPPCADLLIRHSLKKVVISNFDPNPLVAGKGIAKLREAGIEVIENVLEAEGRELNKRFFTFIEQKRPYIILKWAETADGFIARSDGSSKWISNDLSRKLVHRWRAEEDAVLVGTQTALIDDPQLNVRNWSGRDPIRIVIDRDLRLPASLKLFDGSQKTLIYNLIKNEEQKNNNFVRLEGIDFLSEMFDDMYQRKIQSLIIEGGSQLLNVCIRNNYFDEIRVFRAENIFNEGIEAPKLKGQLISKEYLDDNLIVCYRK